MVYDNKPSYGDGQWHCPFPKEWVERKKRAAKCCEQLSAEYIEAAIDREVYSYKVPPGNFLEEEQDARGLPMSWCKDYDERHKDWPICCTAIYDYSTIPEVVVTNGADDWPYLSQTKTIYL